VVEEECESEKREGWCEREELCDFGREREEEGRSDDCVEETDVVVEEGSKGEEIVTGTEEEIEVVVFPEREGRNRKESRNWSVRGREVPLENPSPTDSFWPCEALQVF
jgi:hypothetical protein